MKLPCIHDSTISDAAEKRYTFPVQAVQKGMTYSDLTGHHRITDGSNIAGVPLYHGLRGGTAVHLQYEPSKMFLQFLFQPLDGPFGFPHFLSAVADAVAFF